MNETAFSGPDQATTLFETRDRHPHLRQLCGLPCWPDSGDGRATMQSPAVVSCDGGPGDAFALVEHVFVPRAARFAWSAAGGALRLESEWSFCPDTAVVGRKDSLVNTGTRPLTVRRCAARFALAPGRYEVYAQDSRWCGENQGAWIALHAGGVRLGGEAGRTTQGGTPYVGLGFADDDLRVTLAPGASLACPLIILQALPDGKPASAAPRLHRWISGHLLPPILFAYRLNDGATVRRFTLRGLRPAATYSVHWHVPRDRPDESATGMQLMAEGAQVGLPGRFQAAVVVVTAASPAAQKPAEREREET